MGILTAALAMLLQERAGGGDLRFEDVKIIAERNIFSPVKPKEISKKKEEIKKEERKAESPLPPMITGFEGYPDGFRILICDRGKNSSVRLKVGDALAGGVIESIDTTRAVVKSPAGEVIELRNGDTISNGIPPPPNASAFGRIGVALASAMDKTAESEGSARGNKRKQVEEEQEEETPRKKKRWNRP